MKMAYSNSIKHAQAIKFCERCAEDSIKWRCIDCNMGLCVKCKTSHLKIPVTSRHQMITIGTPLSNAAKKIALDNIPCKDHPNKMVGFLCRSCDSHICPECVSFSHKKHIFVPIEFALNEKLDYLHGIHDRIDGNLKSCESKTSELQDIKSKYNDIFNESLRKIKEKEQELINGIQKGSKELQEKVEHERSQVNRNLGNIEENIDNYKKNLEDQRDEIDAILTSSQGSIIFKANMIIIDLKFNFPPYQIQQFIPAPESTKKIQESFGYLRKMSISSTHAPPKMDFEVIGTFTTDLPFIDTLITLDETSAWITCDDKQVIRKVDIQDNNMTTSQEVSLKVYDIALTPNNELLLSMNNGSDVKLLKKTGEVVSFLTVAPLLPYGIHVTKDNNIILGVTEDGNTYKPTEQSRREVIIFDMTGKQKDSYQYDKDGERLFTVPTKITTNNNQDILVIDGLSLYNGRVVVLNKERNLRWSYEGHHKINASKQFDARDIVTTAVGHVIVSDISSHALHVLSENGEVLTCKIMRDVGVIYPWGLDFDDMGRLWLGCGTGGEDTGAKLYIMNLF